MGGHIFRDRRASNHMDEATRSVHDRLLEWASWSRGGEVRAWPARTLLGRIIEEGPGASEGTRPPVAMPDAVAVVDAAVARLRALDRAVIRTYYLRWEPVEVMARRHHMRVRQFQSALRRARWHICGFIAGRERDG